jgi:hypothetical protein
MPIESATYINSLNSANPASSDPVADSDNHIRLIKDVLKNTFPNVSGPVSLTQFGLNGGVPIGGVIMWSGALASLPTGWALCAGGTFTRSDGGGSIVAPDLRDRFVIGAGGLLDVSTTGGSKTPTGTTDAQGAHSHPSSITDVQGYHTHVASAPVDASRFQVSGAAPLQTQKAAEGSHTHAISTDGGHAHNVYLSADGVHVHNVTLTDGRPPYLALAYIMKI